MRGYIGRPYKTVYAAPSSPPFSISYYNGLGQLTNQVDADGDSTLYAYNGKGERVYSAADIEHYGSIDFSGTDRITFTTNDVVSDHSAYVQRTRTYVWSTLSSNSSNLVSTVENSTDGLQSWQIQYRDASTSVTNHSQTAYGSSGTRTVTMTAPDSSYTISLYSTGRLASVTRYDSTGTQIGQTTYAYDPHGRQSAVTDARNGTTYYTFNYADQIITTTTPNPGSIGGAPETTTASYDTSLRAWQVIQPDGTIVTNIYLPTGELGLTFGSGTYPVGYGYDYAGRMQTMTNWSGFSAGTGARVTTWNYDSYRGWLTNKTYDGRAAGPVYSNTPAGRLQSRTWARTVGGSPLTTTYSYDPAGSLTNVAYSDSTTPLIYTYDRLGRQVGVVQGGMTTTLAYNLANQLLSESYSGGPLSGLTVANTFDNNLRRTNLSVVLGTTLLSASTYAYDPASRLSSVSDGSGNSAGYSYLANSPLVGQINFTNSGALRMTTTKQYDYLNRLSQISSAGTGAASSPAAFNYSYNGANQRIRTTEADNSYWIYDYDPLGQVTSGHKFWSDGSAVAGQHFDYAFDTIGNRTQTKAGGDQNGWNQRVANYYANNLNQYTNRDFPGFVDIMGLAFATNAVTVNGQAPCRKIEYFREQLPINNGSSAVWTNITVAANGQTSVTGHEYLPQTPELFTYDADGNLSTDGRWQYTWDAENRLIDMTSLSNAPAGSLLKLDFTYDWKGRRIQKIVSTNSGSGYVAESTNLFGYDGWDLVASGNTSLFYTYVWGSDLSGSLQGAGGVGGLLEFSTHNVGTGQTTNCFAAFDGNGNVGALVNAADGTVAAQYEYGPFGELLRATGPMAKANTCRFSTKYQDDESDFIYYGYRYYSPSTGVWLNRDPIEEQGGLDLFLFVANSPVNQYDNLGLAADRPAGPPTPIDPLKPPKKKPIIKYCIGGWCDFLGINHTFHTECPMGVYYGKPTDQKALDSCLSKPSKQWENECGRNGGPIESKMKSICTDMQNCFKKYWPQSQVN